MPSRATELVNCPLNKTKVVATIGPASESPEMLERLIRAGLNVARLNFSHDSNPRASMTTQPPRTPEKQEQKRKP